MKRIDFDLLLLGRQFYKSKWRMPLDADVIVIGAGVVGAALAYGLLQQGQTVIVLDGGDRDPRAARANFGLVWVQGKGANTPAYNALSRKSSDLWPAFRQELAGVSATRVDYSRPGGLAFCLSEDEYVARSALIQRTHNHLSDPDTEMVDRLTLERMMPSVRLGPDVVGASFCKLDGVVNPLHLLAALHRAITVAGGKLLFRNPVANIVPSPQGFSVQASDHCLQAPKVVVAAGLATPSLTEPLGMAIPLRSERGQILVSERVEPILPYPANGLRQTAEGTVMIGATKENLSDAGVTVASATTLARRATRIIPALSSARLVRQWSGFRVLPPDGAPIYAQSTRYPGLFAAVCHSGVTLAAAHAVLIAPAIAAGLLSESLEVFSNGRFDV